MARQTSNRPRGGAADFTQSSRKAAPAPKKQTKSTKKAAREPEDLGIGSVLWKLGLILCAGLVIFSLLFASVNGGSQYVGLPEQENTQTTPTPPASIIDPALNVSGSDQTPIPPSPTPGIDATTDGTNGGDAAAQNPTP